MRKFILIHGLKGHGKSSTANMLEDELSKLYNTKQLILADPIREMLSRAFEVPFDVFDHEDIKNDPNDDLYGETPRRVIQLFATEFAHNCFGENIWCKITENRANALNQSTDIFIIPDVRFEHEVEHFKDKMLYMIFVRREGAGQTDTHRSEQGLYHLYDENNERMFFLDLPKESTLEGTNDFIKNIIIDKILEVR